MEDGGIIGAAGAHAAARYDGGGLRWAGQGERRGDRRPPEPAPRYEAPRPEVEKPKVWVATHQVPPDPDRRLIMLREPDSVRAACFRVLRHRLQHKGDPRVLAITSAEPGEGKSTLAANL